MTDSRSQQRGAEPVKWRRVNDEPFEYAIQQGPHGDEFVKLLDGSFLRRSPSGDVRAAVIEALRPFAAAWHAYGDKPADGTRLADNKGGAYLEACLLTFGDLRRAFEALFQAPATDAGGGKS